MEFLLVAGNVSAERALRLGLLNEVVAPEELMATAQRWAREIVRNAPLAVQATKKSALLGFRAATLEEAYLIEDGCSAEVFATEDAQEGVAAFFERREPCWRGR
jgi:enoyl-CoA hydratase